MKTVTLQVPALTYEIIRVGVDPKKIMLGVTDMIYLEAGRIVNDYWDRLFSQALTRTRELVHGKKLFNKSYLPDWNHSDTEWRGFPGIDLALDTNISVDSTTGESVVSVSISEANGVESITFRPDELDLIVCCFPLPILRQVWMNRTKIEKIAMTNKIADSATIDLFGKNTSQVWEAVSLTEGPQHKINLVVKEILS